MGPYYDHHWRDRQQNAPAADRDPLGRAGDRALGTLASGWTLAGMPVRALATFWRTDGRRAGHLAAHPGYRIDRPWAQAREDGTCT